MKNYISSIVKNLGLPFYRNYSTPKYCFYESDQIASVRNLFVSQAGQSCVRIGGIEADATYRLVKYGNISRSLLLKLRVNAGFYPRSRSDLFRFAFENCLSLTNATIAAYWNSKFQCELFEHIGIQKPLITLKSLEPITTKNDWLSEVARPVCVISPFVDTMKSQFERLNKIHADVDLSSVDFRFVKAPLTNGLYSDSVSKPSWFERLEELEQLSVCTGARVALIGAGSYGLPLAERLRRKGFVSIVCGGALQLLFGIYGKRWQDREDYKHIINASWVKPSESEKPVGYKQIEGGCYW